MMKLALLFSLFVHLTSAWLFYTMQERPGPQEERIAKLLPSVVTDEHELALPEEAYPPLSRVPHDL